LGEASGGADYAAVSAAIKSMEGKLARDKGLQRRLAAAKKRKDTCTFDIDSAEKPNSPKKGSEKDHQNTLPENQNGLYAIPERIFLILFS